MNVFIEDTSYAYEQLFIKAGFKIVNTPEIANLAVFTGGADVTASLYGDSQHPFTDNDVYRDAREATLFHYLKSRKVPMVGICRGGQFLNVMSGGRMYQHVSKHTMAHEIIDARSGETLLVSSTHHQMMFPGEKAEVIAFSNLGGSREWYDGSVFKREVSETDYEVLFYEETKSLCFQPHPEFSSEQYVRMQEYFFSLVNEFLFAKEVV